MRLALLCTFLFLFSSKSFGSSTFDGVISATNLFESKAFKEQRKNRLLQLARSLEIPQHPVPPKLRFQEFSQALISRMVLGEDLDSVSKAILAPSFVPWNVGTDISILGSVCKRVGDYDFVLMSLLPVAYLNEGSGRTLLTSEARNKLVRTLMSRRGGEIYKTFKLDNCIGVKVTDTENHILMTAVAQLLTNQLLFKDEKKPEFDNNKNGLNVWILNHLQEFMKTGFSEFNARPYQGYTWIALTNLYEYSEDQKVKVMAQMVLDYLSAKFAVQSLDLRRYGPIRRQIRYHNIERLTSGDRVSDWFKMTAGNFGLTESLPENLNGPLQNYFAFFSAIQSYTPPDFVLDILLSKEEPIFQKFKESDPEIYFSSPSFLLSAGGRHRNQLDAGDGQNDALGFATTLMPKGSEMQLSRLFHFVGHNKRFEVNNTCLFKNFACGYNLHIPRHIPSECRVSSRGGWDFFDLNNCPVSYGVYVAVKSQRSIEGRSKNHGVMEVREASELSFEDFRKIVLSRNKVQTLRESGEGIYHTSRGDRIRYDMSLPTGKNTILRVNSKDQTKGFQFWKLAEGDVINSSGNGLIEVKYQGRSLTLDARDANNPQRVLN